MYLVFWKFKKYFSWFSNFRFFFEKNGKYDTYLFKREAKYDT